MGIFCFSIVGYAYLDRVWSEQEMARAWDESPVVRVDEVRASRRLEPRSASATDAGPTGRLRIPAIDLEAWVAEGTDARTLRRAVGWIEGTARFGEPGNVGLAAHRDSHFRELGKLERGDRIAVTTDHGEFVYEVDSIRIVEPDEFEVLADGERSSLSLVTCYPFRYVGRAPLRYVVRAVEVDP
jgi:LPXTG-site transpeptidase (sortase) family protein